MVSNATLVLFASISSFCTHKHQQTKQMNNPYAAMQVDWEAIKQRDRGDGAWHQSGTTATSPATDKVLFDEKTVEVEIEKAKEWLSANPYSHTMYVPRVHLVLSALSTDVARACTAPTPLF